MEFIFITNQPELAAYAESIGIDRIMVDLEAIGKKERQGNFDTLISNHTLDDVKRLRDVIRRSKLQVRVNPIHPDSELEIDKVIAFGADIIMLPMFKTVKEVEQFISMVNSRAIVSLLLETAQALVRIDDILEVGGIDEVYIGLNDLHLGMGLTFMFELLSGGIVEYLAEKIIGKGIKFGFGGIAKIGSGILDPRMILSEHVRLGSEMVILSRSFHKGAESVDELKKLKFEFEVKRLRSCLSEYKNLSEKELLQNKRVLHEQIRKIVDFPQTK